MNRVTSDDDFRATDSVSESSASGSIASYKGGNWVTGWSVTAATRWTTSIETGVSTVLLLLTMTRSRLQWNETKTLRRVSDTFILILFPSQWVLERCPHDESYSEELVPANRNRVTPRFRRFLRNVPEQVGRTIQLIHLSFDALPIPVGGLVDAEAVLVACRVQPRYFLDQTERAVDGICHAIFLQGTARSARPP